MVCSIKCLFCGQASVATLDVPLMHADSQFGEWTVRVLPACNACTHELTPTVASATHPLCGACANLGSDDYLCTDCTTSGQLIVAPKNATAESVATLVLEAHYGPLE